MGWRCPICPDREFVLARSLARHVEDWHEEWLEGGRVPPRPA